jgi:hypothetical protein
MKKKPEIDESYEAACPEGLQEEWHEFLQLRKRTAAGYPTPFAQKLLLKRLQEYSGGSVDLARRIIENSIIGGPRGPYEKFYALRDEYRSYEPMQFRVTDEPQKPTGYFDTPEGKALLR